MERIAAFGGTTEANKILEFSISAIYNPHKISSLKIKR
jgi:hypothetical protein